MSDYVFWNEDGTVKDGYYYTQQDVRNERLRRWQREMEDLDKVLPRAVEDVIEALSQTSKDKLPQIVKDRLALKAAKRAARPQ